MVHHRLVVFTNMEAKVGGVGVDQDLHQVHRTHIQEAVVASG